MGTKTSSRAHREARRRRAARARREQLTRDRAYGLPPVSETTPAPRAQRALGRVRARLAKASLKGEFVLLIAPPDFVL